MPAPGLLFPEAALEFGEQAAAVYYARLPTTPDVPAAKAHHATITVAQGICWGD
jgi:hypothetical protein